jgi:hypothetical protein
MLAKTLYRIVKYGDVEYLQYLKTYNVLFLKWTKWKYIPYPCSSVYMPHVISSRISKYNNLKKFILCFPDIEMYYETEFLERKKIAEEEKLTKKK